MTRKRLLVPLILGAWMLVAGHAGAQTGPASSVRYLEFDGEPYDLVARTDRIAVGFVEGAQDGVREAVRQRYAILATSVREEAIPVPPVSIYTLASSRTAAELADRARELMADEEIRFATPIYRSFDIDVLPTDELFLQLEQGTTDAELETLLRDLGAELVERTLWRDDNYKVRVRPESGRDAIDVAADAMERLGVVFSQPNFIRFRQEQSAPTDSLFDDQWGLHNTSQVLTFAFDCDLDAPEGWDIQEGSSDVTIAVLDTGVDLDHPDLEDNIVAGRDIPFGDGIAEPFSWDGHGTACMGIAGAIANNGEEGIAGVASGCDLMPIRIFYHAFQGAPLTTMDAWDAEGVAWAYTHGADVISCSWGGGPPSYQTRAAMRDATLQGRGGLGAVVVAAAGNDLDGPPIPGPVWPSLYSEVMSIASTSPCDELKRGARPGDPPPTCDNDSTYWSHFGEGLDCAAPGTLIPTTDIADPGAGYDTTSAYITTFNGTSSATPHVAGLAALLISKYPTWQGTQIRARIQQTCDKVGGYNYDPVTGISEELGHGRINIYRALSGKPQVVLGPDPDFPSVYRDHGDAPIPYPDAYHESSAYEWLGVEYSPEKGLADAGDPDGKHNRPGGDGFDDGVVFYPPYEPGQMGQIDVRISVEDHQGRRYDDADELLYLNVWFDWQSDGDWNTTFDWVVENRPIAPSGWGGNSELMTLTFQVPDDDIDWHIQNDQDGSFLHVRARVSYQQQLNTAGQTATWGEVEDYQFINFVEMFDVGMGFLSQVAGCPDVWQWFEGQEGWQPASCPPPFRMDGPGENGYVASYVDMPDYQADDDDGLRTPSFDFSEMTEAFMVAEYSGIELAMCDVVVYVDGVRDSILHHLQDPTVPPACAILVPGFYDLSHYCDEDYDDVQFAFEVYNNEPCGTSPPAYQDIFVDNIVIWATDRITPAEETVTIAPTDTATVELTWTTPGDDGHENRAELYNLRYGPEPIDNDNWRHSLWVRPDMVTAIPVPEDPGTAVSLTVQRLSGGMPHFSLRTLDEVNNIAGITDAGSNHGPTLVAPEFRTVMKPDSLTFTIKATDPDFDPIIYYVHDGPSGVVVVDSAGLGYVGWGTRNVTPDRYTIVFGARDWSGAVHLDTTEVRVLPLVAPDWDDHDNNDCLFTVTDQGILGYLDGSRTSGSGFVYPFTRDTSHLYLGGLWLGESDSYVANRDYDADPEKEWRVAPGGALATSTHGALLKHEATYTDSLAHEPRGLWVEMETWSYGSPAAFEDFVVLEYTLTNHGAETLTDLHVGVFLDLDMQEQGGDDTAGTDLGRDLTYVTDAEGIYAGLRYLPHPTDPTPVANVTLVDNPTFVYANQYILDADKYAFLSAADGAHILHNGATENDYSVLVSGGPFDLAPGNARAVAFAVIGANSLSALEQNADHALDAYTGYASTEEKGARFMTRLFSNRPNPFARQTSVRFSLERASRVDLSIFDVTGRRVRTVVNGSLEAGEHSAMWDRRNEEGIQVAGGVYFLRMKAADREMSRPMVVIR